MQKKKLKDEWKWNPRDIERSDRDTQHLPAWLLWLMGALLLHHCCWYNWLPRQYKPTPPPTLPRLCVFLCSFQLPSLTRLLMERMGGGRGPHKAGVYIHTHTTLHSLGALICLNDYPAPLHPLPPSIALLCGSYRGRHDAILCAPPAVPSTMRGTLASQCDPPTPPPHPSPSQHDIIAHMSHSAPQRLCCSLEERWECVF